MYMHDISVVVIGGGGTGAAITYDLCERGLSVTLVERGELTSGTTGRHHGQLHCGARYAMADTHIAKECMKESRILRQIAPDAIEYNGGLFVAVTDEDYTHTGSFIEACLEAGIPAQSITTEQALAYEPALSEQIQAAVLVPDGTIDPWRLALHFFAGAKQTGRAVIRPYTEVVGIETGSSGVTGVAVRELITGRTETIPADIIINAAGPWAGTIAQLAGADLSVSPSPGTMLAVKGRLTDMVISRLHPAGDGDIIVPQRELTIIGSTQWLSSDPDIVRIPEGDIPFLLRAADQMLPSFSTRPHHMAWAAARPLYGSSRVTDDVRSLSRDFSCIDHGQVDKIRGLFSVVGGKATTLRAMGEITADAVCSACGITAPCTTDQKRLPAYRSFYTGGLYGAL
jgi:glycerol-3-phosphate dehydrogenase